MARHVKILLRLIKLSRIMPVNQRIVPVGVRIEIRVLHYIEVRGVVEIARRAEFRVPSKKVTSAVIYPFNQWKNGVLDPSKRLGDHRGAYGLRI